MSNSIAMAAVTATLQTILHQGLTSDPDLGDTLVTMLPPDKARGARTANQLNLFLYQVLPNAAWRNRDMPQQVQPGETGRPPLPLNLYYLITAFGKQDDSAQPNSHQVLGKAMSLLHDHPVLSPEDIKTGTGAFPLSDLQLQIERVRITLQPLSVEEISKLWTGFATQYRLSAAYEASVILIESTLAARTPLPVLTRSKDDAGIGSTPQLTAPYPTLEQVIVPARQPSAVPGDTLTLVGHHLDGAAARVLFSHALLTSPIEVAPEPNGTSTRVDVVIPNQPAAFPAGFYTISYAVQRPNETFRRVTNQLSFALAPRMTIAPASTPAAATITYTVDVGPEVRPEQRAVLLVGDREIPADPHDTQTDTLTFQASGLASGDYFVRLRVDGVDTHLVKRDAVPPVFDATQKVTVT